MLQSRIVQANGVFVGAAISSGGGFRFRAVHPSVEDLDDSVWGSLDTLERTVTHLFTTGRLGVVSAPVHAAGSGGGAA